MKRIHKISRLGACSFKHAPYLLLQYKLYSGIFCRGISWLLIGNSVLANEEQLTAVRRHMGMVFQYSALFDSMTVGENVAFGLRQHTKDDEATIQRIVKEKLRLVGLEGIEDMMPNDLSGGMKKRVSLARAIALDPQVILYDEPTAGLDPLRCMDINRLVVSMQKQIHATSVIVTHDMDSAFYVADRLAYLQDGRFRLIADKKTFAHTQDEEVQRFIHGGRLPEERGDSL